MVGMLFSIPVANMKEVNIGASVTTPAVGQGGSIR
jgi:hypothetical protein